MSDPLRSAIHELYDSELAHLLETYRLLAFHATGTYRGLYLAVAAHLEAERRRRLRTWTAMVADLLDDGTAGEIVPEVSE